MRSRIARAAATVGVVAVAGTAVAQAAAPAGLEWSGRHFASKQALATWLASRGVSYTDWARRHPGGVYLLTHPRPKPKPVAVTTPALVPPPLVALQDEAASSSNLGAYLVPLAIAFVLIALVPLQWLPNAERLVPESISARTLEIRASLVACAATLVLALLLTRALG